MAAFSFVSTGKFQKLPILLADREDQPFRLCQWAVAVVDFIAR
jgi:hypothetical protein